MTAESTTNARHGRLVDAQTLTNRMETALPAAEAPVAAGPVPAPHFSAELLKPELVERVEGDEEEGDETADNVSYQNLDLDLVVQIHASGLNSGLNRPPRVQTASIPLLEKPQSTNRWTPRWDKVQTVKLVFPEGFEFLPPPSEKPARPPQPDAKGDPTGPTQEELLALLPPGATLPVPEEPKQTRIKPPKDAVSIEDRLFYLLQPPLETWLKGQELIMPFEPSPY